MNIIAVDDEFAPMRQLERAIREAVPGCNLATFGLVDDALAYAETTRPDVAFLDIELPGIGGLACAQKLKERCPAINIVFVTGYSSYAEDAFGLHASGYLRKPVDAEDIRKEMGNLRVAPPTEQPRVQVQCFGGFAVFVEGKPLVITRAKPKELLAYLVHKRGATVSNAEIAAVLWEDEENSPSVQSNTRKVISRLVAVLKAAGVEDIICKSRNNTGIDTSKISCDYYDYLAGKQGAHSFKGEYLSEYSWAEVTLAFLNRQTE